MISKSKIFLIAITLWVGVILFSYGTPVFAADYVIVVNKKNPLASISKNDLSKIYRKAQQFWVNGDPIELADLEDNDKVTLAFYNDILKKTPEEMKVYWIRQMVTRNVQPPVKMTTGGQVVRFVGSNEGAIGYVPSDAADSSVKQIPIKD